MAEFDHWLPLHVGDYLSDTMHLTTLQHGIYIRLIMHYWKRRHLPADDRVLSQIAGLSYQSFRRVCAPVMALFTLNLASQNGDRESRFSHRRLDIEIAKAREISEVRKAAGRKGNAKRYGWQMPGDEAGKCAGTRARDSLIPYPYQPSNPPEAPPERGGVIPLDHHRSPKGKRRRGDDGWADIGTEIAGGAE